MKFKIIDPTLYPEWNYLIKSSFDPDIFNTREWCQVIKSTYNLTPTYFITIIDRQPEAIIPLFEIKSPFTGKRAVGLPFSDFCHPLIKDPNQANELIEEIINFGTTEKWKYVEFRSSNFPALATPASVYYTHDIDLTKSSSELWSRLKDSNKRNIKKAMRSGLQVSFEKDLQAMRNFYRLQIITRKRHGLPPQPFKFFKNIYDEIISKNLGIMTSVYYRGKMIAASIFFNFNQKALFKFGASDHFFHPLRPNNLIMWEAIRWHQENGCHLLNLGRTNITDSGLLSYKRSWGAKENKLYYYRLTLRKIHLPDLKLAGDNAILNRVSRVLPASLLRLMGNLLYKHLD